MSPYRLLREPSVSMGAPVFLCAAVVFPLHLGWTGTSLPALAGYLLIAAVLFAVADVLTNGVAGTSWRALLPQALLSLMALSVPAAAAFYVGTLVGPVDEAFDEEACAAQGSGELDSFATEADDTFDVTPDCAERGG